MKNLIAASLLISLISLFNACQPRGKNVAEVTASLESVFDSYWNQRMQLFPLEATASGDNRYNDRLTITIAESFRDSLKRFYKHYQDELKQVDSSLLSEKDLLSYRLFQYEMAMNLEGLKHPVHLMPINQFWAFTLEVAQMGSGTGNQPFKTISDYNHWIKRMSYFPAWVDTAIVNMRKGIQTGWVLPAPLVAKMLPQINAMLVTDITKSTFYGPVDMMPDSFSTATKEAISADIKKMIETVVIPSYRALYNFMKQEYLPAARHTSGVGSLSNGADYYSYCVRYWTTTDLTPDSIYRIGLSEVAQIERQMHQVMKDVGYDKDLQSFFAYIGKDKAFFPFSSSQQVIDSFWSIKKAEDPMLERLFNNKPKTQFTIRQTEAFRAASASAEYNPGTADGSRPGIFYVPILDARKFNAVGMETLFLHEAIPGHHYQISLQQEDTSLPKFRRFLWYGAYGEGWALYSESLGKELGLFKNPYQYFGHLSDAMHRAIRLVVDVGLHAKGWTREQAIDYMLTHERISPEEAAAEIERYMALPGQALSYKIGQLGIRAQRSKYEKKLGARFNLATFHDAVLRTGVVPLDILEENLGVSMASEKS